MRGDTSSFPRDKSDGISFITITSADLGNVGLLCLCMCVLFLTRDVAFLFNIICLKVVANGFYYNPEPR